MGFSETAPEEHFWSYLVDFETGHSGANLIDKAGRTRVVPFAGESKVECDPVRRSHHGLDVGLPRRASSRFGA